MKGRGAPTSDPPEPIEDLVNVSQFALRYVAGRARTHTLSIESAKGYRIMLAKFAREIGNPPPRRITRRMIVTWLEHQDVSASSLRTRFVIVRGFFRWLVVEEVIKVDPMATLVGPSATTYKPRGLPIDAVHKLLAVLPDSRAHLIVSLMVQEGLRAGEVARVQIGWVSFDERLLLVRGKGNRERVLPISDESFDALKRYLEDEPATVGPLIRSHRQGQERDGLTSHGVGQLVSAWCYDAKIKRRPKDLVSAHALRHTAAHDMLRAGAHVRDVQAALGHAELSTTERYLPWIVGDLRKAMGGRTYRREIADCRDTKQCGPSLGWSGSGDDEGPHS